MQTAEEVIESIKATFPGSVEEVTGGAEWSCQRAVRVATISDVCRLVVILDDDRNWYLLIRWNDREEDTIEEVWSWESGKFNAESCKAIADKTVWEEKAR